MTNGRHIFCLQAVKFQFMRRPDNTHKLFHMKAVFYQQFLEKNSSLTGFQHCYLYGNSIKAMGRLLKAIQIINSSKHASL